MNDLRTVPVGVLEPNDWNPNQMTDEEFSELVAEVRHLGRLPKPLIAREVEGRLVIVDGEHGWRAAQEAGLEEVLVEVVDVDAFEAMRQTYKRNQHGTHNPVLLGRMFKRMLDERGMSKRALAAEAEVSEGTVRNMLLYAEASELAGETEDTVRGAVRNGYAPARIRANRNRQAVATLSVAAVRRYIELPDVIRDAWLLAGANEKLLEEVLRIEVHWPGERGLHRLDLGEERLDPFQSVADAGLSELFDGSLNFRDAATKAFELITWQWALDEHLDDADAYLAPAVDILKSYTVSPDEILCYLPLREQADDRRLHCPIPPDRWATILSEAIKDDSLVWSRITAGVTLALKEHDAWDDDEAEVERDPQARLTMLDAPDFIRDAKISLKDKVALVRAVAPNGTSAEELLELKQAAIPSLEDKHRLISEGIHYVDTNGQGFEKWGPGRQPLWRISVDTIIGAHFDRKRKQEQLDARSALFTSRTKMIAAIVEAVGEKFRRDDAPTLTKDKRKAADVLTERLDELPMPELVLLACVVSGEGDPGETWLRAVDERDPATKTARRRSLKGTQRLAELEAQFGRGEPAA